VAVAAVHEANAAAAVDDGNVAAAAVHEANVAAAVDDGNVASAVNDANVADVCMRQM